MRAIIATGPDKLELNYMWLPTWIGLNAQLKKELEEALIPEIVGMEITEDNLDEANDKILDFIEKKYASLKGLRDYLDGLKFVEE